MSTRVTAANGTESTVVVRAEYDSFGRATQYTTSAGGSSSTTTFVYYEIGRLTKATYPAVGGLASAKEWRWNDEARTVTRIDEEGRSLIEQYDQLGRFVELRRPAAPPNMAETAAAKVGFNSLGNVAYEEDAAGRRTLYEYDAFGRMIKTVYPDGSFETTSFEVCRSDPSGAEDVPRRRRTEGTRPAGSLCAGPGLSAPFWLCRHPNACPARAVVTAAERV